MALTPALLMVAVTLGIAGGSGTTGASAAEVPAATPSCLTDDLTGTVIGRPHAAGSPVRTAILELTNTSDRPCQLQGWAQLALVTPPGDLVSVPSRNVNQPQGGAKITLAPQASAWNQLQWDTCEADRKGCGVGVALQYIVDPESTGTVADTTEMPESDLAMKELRISPFQSTRTAAALN